MILNPRKVGGESSGKLVQSRFHQQNAIEFNDDLPNQPNVTVFKVDQIKSMPRKKIIYPNS